MYISNSEDIDISGTLLQDVTAVIVKLKVKREPIEILAHVQILSHKKNIETHINTNSRGMNNSRVEWESNHVSRSGLRSY